MHLLSIIVCSLISVAAAGTCPFLGPVFPAPRSLSTNSAFQASLATLKTSLQNALSSGNTSYGPIDPTDTYSIQVFSTQDKNAVPLLDFHRRGANVVGNRTINGDSIYRIASTTKIFTVYLLLLQVGDGIFADPVTKYLPELKGRGDWDDVSVGALAGYISGVTAEGKSPSKDTARGFAETIYSVGHREPSWQ
jgi:CubicO group peptidase (beta-lactamase class C family)